MSRTARGKALVNYVNLQPGEVFIDITNISTFDEKQIKFGELFRKRFMRLDVSIPLEEALDLCWQTLAECFDADELLMKQNLIDKYFPKITTSSSPVESAQLDSE